MRGRVVHCCALNVSGRTPCSAVSRGYTHPTDRGVPYVRPTGAGGQQEIMGVCLQLVALAGVSHDHMCPLGQLGSVHIMVSRGVLGFEARMW